jgi:hypothetical protein
VVSLRRLAEIHLAGRLARRRPRAWFPSNRLVFFRGNLALGARCSRPSIVIARMAFALAYFLIASGAFLVSTGLIAGALHRNALHSMAAM